MIIYGRLTSGDFITIKVHSSCEIDYFVETHLCKLDSYSDRAHYGLCVLIKDFCFFAHFYCVSSSRT